jgi:hypothetical protein
MTTLLHYFHTDGLTSVLADAVPNPGPQTPKGMTGARDKLLGFIKWGGYSVAAGSLIISGIKMAASGGGRGATTASDAALEIPWKVVGVLIISLGAGLLGEFVGN